MYKSETVKNTVRELVEASLNHEKDKVENPKHKSEYPFFVSMMRNALLPKDEEVVNVIGAMMILGSGDQRPDGSGEEIFLKFYDQFRKECEGLDKTGKANRIVETEGLHQKIDNAYRYLNLSY